MASLAKNENDPFIPLDKEHKQLVRMVDMLRSGKKTRLVSEDGTECFLSDTMLHVVERAAHVLVHGQAVSVVPRHRELTTQEAADILNISRPYLIRLLDKDTLPYNKTGSHRRLKLEDVLAYKAKRDKTTDESLDQLAQLSQDLGLYENE